MKQQILKRPLFFACTFSFAVAVLCAYIDVESMVALMAVLVFSALFLLPFKTPFKPMIFITAAVSVIIVLSNILYCKFYYQPSLKYADTTALIDCTVVNVSDSYLDVKFNDNIESADFKARIYIDEPCDVVPSSRLNVKVTFIDTKRSGTYGICLYGTAYKKDINILSHHNSHSPLYIYHNIRLSVCNLMPFNSQDTSAFVKGMVLGDTSDINGAFYNRLGTVGLSHVMSVSGMHLMFSVLLLDFLLSLVAIGYKPRAFIAIFSVLFFTFITGFSVSCIRAAIMLFVYYVGRISDKLPDSLTSLSLSAIIILIFCPYNSLSVSLWLSLAATFGIVVLTPCFYDLIKIKLSNRFLNVLVHSILRLFTLSLGATVMCMPIIAFVFKSACILSPVVNVILAIPIQALFYVGVLGIVFGAIPFVQGLFSYVADIIYKFIEVTVTKIYFIKHITFSVYDRFFLVCFSVFVVLIIGIYVLYKKSKPVRIAYLYILSFVIISATLYTVDALTCGGVSVNFVNVGHGNCSVIAQNESAIIVDCGGTDMSQLETVLCKERVKRIDTVAITHADKDHIGFLEKLVSTYKIDKIIYPYYTDISDYQYVLESARGNGTKVIKIKDDKDYLLLDDIKFSVFVDRFETVKSGPNLSAAYKLCYKNNSVLYTGDMSMYQERRALEYGDTIDCDILSVAHHGSATSSHPDFLEKCSPEYSVISVGKSGQFNLPSERIVKRLKEISAVFITADISTVTFKLTEKGIKIK